MPSAEDEFAFSRRGEEKPNPAKLFATLLRDGPPVGVFTVAWCDTLNNLNRALGLPDGYLFVLSAPAIEKMRFVHDIVGAAVVSRPRSTDAD